MGLAVLTGQWGSDGPALGALTCWLSGQWSQAFAWSPAAESADYELDQARFVSVRRRPLRRSGWWRGRLRTCTNEDELQLELQLGAIRHRARWQRGGLSGDRRLLLRETSRSQRPETVSLGIRQIRVPDRPDLGIRCTASDRHRPCGTGVNGPPMARGLSSRVSAMGSVWLLHPSNLHIGYPVPAP